MILLPETARQVVLGGLVLVSQSPRRAENEATLGGAPRGSSSAGVHVQS